MFGFLNSIFLPLLGASLIPLLIHLLTRKKPQFIHFSSLRFIQEKERRRMRRMRLKQILLLIIRVLIVLLVVGAFARPVWRGEMAGSAKAHERTYVIIAIDNSYSMGQESGGIELFTRAKAEASHIISMLTSGDELSIIAFNDEPTLLTKKPTRNFRMAEETLDTLSLSGGGTDIASAISAALSLCEESKLLNKELYILTDNRASGWRKLVPLRGKQPSIRIFVIQFEAETDDNRGVVSLEFPHTILERGKPATVKLVARNYSSKRRNGVLASLSVDERRVSQASFDMIPAGSESSVNLPFRVPTGGFHSGFAELEEDNLMMDNRYFFVLRVPEQIRVLIVGDSEPDYIFPKLALNPTGADTSYISVDAISSSRSAGQLLTGYDVLLISGATTLSDEFISRLISFVESGGGLMFIASAKSDMEFFQESVFHRLVALEFEKQKPSSGFLTISSFDLQHPIFEPFKGIGELPEVHFYWNVRAKNHSGYRTIASLSSGDPFILESEAGEGRILILTSGISREESDITTSALFVPLLHRSVQYLSGSIARFEEPETVGTYITRTIEGLPAGSKLILTYPSGKQEYLKPVYIGSNIAVKIKPLQSPGIYSIFSGDSLVDMFAVNVPFDESDAEKLNKKQIEKEFPLTFIDPESNIEEFIFQARFGKELWKTFLWIAFILMILELALGSTYKKPKGQEERYETSSPFSAKG